MAIKLEIEAVNSYHKLINAKVKSNIGNEGARHLSKAEWKQLQTLYMNINYFIEVIAKKDKQQLFKVNFIE